jgi:bifunctional lysine-specific demethylase and histidyl-hydroxylase NO66
VPDDEYVVTATEVLERCVGDAARFASDIWGRQALHHEGSGSFDDLLSLDSVDQIVSTMSPRLPFFRLVKDGDTVPVARYTKRGRTGSTTVTGIADPAKVARLFSDGATIVLQSVHRYWYPLALLCRQLEIALGHPTQVNAYISPPGARGLAVHEDSHDVFVLQAFGRKHWDVYERGRWDGPGDPALSVILEPGQCLYLPKGTPHGARTQESLSGHITVGILARTWGEVVGDAIDRLRDEPQFAEPLPAGFHREPEAFAAAVADRLDEAGRLIEKIDPREVAAQDIRRFLTGRPPVLKGLFRDLARLPDLTDGSLVGRREGAICELDSRGDRLHAMLGDREVAMPGWLAPAMDRILRSKSLRVIDLAKEIPGAKSRLVLVKRLVREGLLEVIE